ncbi:hypothetical protein MKW94_014633 [Papaver nudicaule]|uniref:Uncharacterized protein n=1 Tax=Papaver nudicaule TaxID=74823 RepID=A0AA41VU18_PAPNU|nr:hypothetical protein [Papaver nudicaule]
MVKNKVKTYISYGKSTKSAPTPKKKLFTLQIILKDKSKKSHDKQTPKKKRKSLEQPDHEMTPRRSSPRFKNISKEPDCAEKTSPTRSPLGKRKLLVEPEKSQPLQSASGASQAAASSTEVVNKSSKEKRKLYSGPCPNVQLRNPNDTLEDMLDDEENEENDEHEPENDVAEREVENEDKENKNEGEDHDTGKVQEAEVSQQLPKRKYVPRGPTRMKALGLTVDNNDTKNKKDGKQILSFNSKDQPIGDPSVALASVLGVLVRRNIALKNLDWIDVPGDTKNNLWAIVKQRFIVDDFYKDYYVGKMGGYLKEARSRKARKILALDELEEEERVKKLEALKPENDTVTEWEEFVKHVCLDEFRVSSMYYNIYFVFAFNPFTFTVVDDVLLVNNVRSFTLPRK